MDESGKKTLTSQFVQLPDTPTNFHRSSTYRSTKLAKSLKPSPQLPQRERIQYGYFNHVSRTFAYSIHQASSRFLHSKCFPRFPPPTPPNVKRSDRNLKLELQQFHIRAKYQISLRPGRPFVSKKYLNFQNYPPPPTPPKRADPVRLCQSRILDRLLFFPSSFILISPL